MNHSVTPLRSEQVAVNRRFINAFLCAAFYLFYEIFYGQVAVFNDGAMRAIYDPDIMAMWRGWLIIAAAAPALFSPNSHRASNIFSAMIYFMVYIPILVVIPNHLSTATSIYCVFQVFLGMTLILYISGFDFNLKVGSRKSVFWAVFGTISAICLFLMITHAISSGVKITGIEDNESLREELNMSSATTYAVNLWTGALGPLWMGIFLFNRRYSLFALTSLSFLVVYGISFQKFMLFTPGWVLGFYLLCRLFKSGTFLVTLIGAATPAFIALASQLTPMAYYGSGYVGYRMYGIHGMIFTHYVDFFEKNPGTLFSHIKGINWFIHYPYNEVLPLIIGASYPGGNQNAHFWAMDAVAGAGVDSIAWVSVVFGVIMVALNSAANRLPASLVIPSLSVVALRFADGPIGTNLLTGGLGLLIFLLFLMPREPLLPSKND